MLSFDAVNLALNKPATASGAENDGTVAMRAVDGDLTSRWSSRHQDNEWLAVDLEECYQLTSVKLYWEAAYATAYDIELSDDGENYRVVKAVTGAQGGVQTVDIRVQGQAVPARWVRIYCKARSTGYGSSLWEIEVYGEALCKPLDTAIELQQITNDVYKFIRNGQIYISRNGTVYTIDGRVLVHEQER